MSEPTSDGASSRGERVALRLGGGLLAVLAALGWWKLRFGFNFIDEGMYMTDGWRLTAGDDLVRDGGPSVMTLYVLLNEVLFRLFPDATLLFFRRLEHLLALGVILATCLTTWRWTRHRWLVPVALAGFAFTGLDGIGMSSNLSYYTWPHAFLTLHVVLLLHAVDTDPGRARRRRDALLAASGAALWALGFCLLPLAAVPVGVVALWLFCRRPSVGVVFTRRDLAVVLAPVAIGWGCLLGVLGSALVGEALAARRRLLESHVVEGFDPLGTVYLVLVAGGFVSLLGALRMRGPARSAAVAGVGLALAVVVSTNAFDGIPRYWRGWFAAPAWLAALVIVGLGAIAADLFLRRRRGAPLDREQTFLLVVLCPTAAFAALFVHFSTMSLLAAVHTGIPILPAVAVFVVRWADKAAASPRLQIGALLALLAPFEIAAGVHDWNFTYFDLPPSMLHATIEDGFAAGIRTNPGYRALARWMAASAARHSRPGDLAIAMEKVPMTYMLINRRPALNHSWTGAGHSGRLRFEAMATMLAHGRAPRLAYVFDSLPVILPVGSAGDAFEPGERLTYSLRDPIYAYIQHNMDRVETFAEPGAPGLSLYVSRQAGAPGRGP